MNSQLSLFGDSSAPTKKIPAKPSRNHVGACNTCKKLICRCDWDALTSRLARNENPESSKRAAKKVEVTLSWRQAIVWSAIQMMCKPTAPDMVTTVIASGGKHIDIELGDKSYTANEIALFCIQELEANATQDTLRRRLSELVEKRLCLRSPFEQFCRFSGQEVIGYSINPDIESKVSLPDAKGKK